MAPMNARLLRPIASRSGFLPADADARAYVVSVNSADGQPLEQAVVEAIEAFVVGCKADGIWDAIKASCILMGARTLAGALTPLKGGAPTNVNNNFVSGDYDRETGLLGNGTSKCLDTNRAANADPQDNFSHGVYVSSGAYTASTQSLIGHNLGGTLGASQLILRPSGNSDLLTRNRVTVTTAVQFSLSAAAVPEGLIGSSRSSGANYQTRIAGSNATVTQGSAAPSSANQFVFNRTATDASFASTRLAFYWLGESLDLALLDTRVSRLYEETQFAINTGVSGSGYDIDTLRYINAGYAAGGSLA
jgi:hypothetical protein